MNTGTPSHGIGYYRIYKNNNDLMTVVYMREFDESDYIQERFVKNTKRQSYYFENEDDAVEQLNEWYEPREIDPDYRLDQSLVR